MKNLFGADGKKIAYYQVNATYFSALGEDERKLRLARAIQMFMPGIPQVWYLDLFAGTNDYEAATTGDRRPQGDQPHQSQHGRYRSQDWNSPSCGTSSSLSGCATPHRHSTVR